MLKSICCVKKKQFERSSTHILSKIRHICFMGLSNYHMWESFSALTEMKLLKAKYFQPVYFSKWSLLKLSVSVKGFSFYSVLFHQIFHHLNPIQTLLFSSCSFLFLHRKKKWSVISVYVTSLQFIQSGRCSKTLNHSCFLSSCSLYRTKATTTLLLSTTCWWSGSRPIAAASQSNSVSTPASDDPAPSLNRLLSR